MTLFAAGPIDFQVLSGHAPPRDWQSLRSADRPSHTVDVELRSETPALAPNLRRSESDALDGITCVPTQRACVFHRRGAFDAQLDLDTLHATYSGIVDVPSPDASITAMPLVESFLRACTASLLLRAGGALWHGSSVAVNGGGYLFCGLSGAGKTTLVENTADGVYLSDDQSIMSVEDGQPFLWGSPFSGLAARRAAPARVPLRAVVLLSSNRPTQTHLVRRTDAARAAAEILRHVCSFERTVEEAARGLAVVEQLVKNVPVFSLTRHIDTPLLAVLAAIDEDSSAAEHRRVA